MMSSDRLKQMLDELVADASPKSRERVAERLRAAGPEAVPVLITALGHGSRFVRMTAASVLGDLQAAEAVPALIETMGGDSVRAQRTAMRALISIGEPALGPLKEACGSENPRAQRHALTALRVLEVHDAVDEALEALQSEAVGVRREAAKLLVVSGDGRAFEAAVDCLSDEDIAEAVAHALMGMGERGRQVLVETARGGDRVARRAAAVILAKEGGPEALGALIESYAEGEIPVGWEAPEFIEAALAAGREVPFDQLLEQAGGAHLDPDEPWAFHSQRPAISALGKVGDPRAIPVLKDLLSSDHAVLARVVAEALGEIGTPECVELLVETLGHEDASVRGAAGLALVRLQDKALEAVLDVLGSENRAQRENAANVLSDWGELALPGVLRAAVSDSATERWGALLTVNALAVKHPQAVTNELRGAVIAALDDEDARVRRSAASAESTIRDEAAIPALMAQLMDPDRQVRRKCARALADVGAPAMTAIVEAMREGEDGRELCELGRALGAMGEAGVGTALELADHPSSVVRWGAGIALGQCGSPRAVPGLVKLAHADEDGPATAAMWALGDFPSEEAVEALEYIASNEGLDKDLRRDARGAAKGLRERLRLEAEAPVEDDDQ